MPLGTLSPVCTPAIVFSGGVLATSLFPSIRLHRASCLS